MDNETPSTDPRSKPRYGSPDAIEYEPHPDQLELDRMIAAVAVAVRELPTTRLPWAIGRIEHVRAAAWLRMHTATPDVPTTPKIEATPSRNGDGGRLMTVAEVADRTGIARWRVYELTSKGDLPSVRLGRSVRIRENELHRWLDSGGTSAREDPAA